MGFLKGSATFVRFKVNGPKPRAFGEPHLARLREYKLHTQRVASADAVETGWAGGGHVMDGDFSELKNVYPDHLFFDFWTQTDKLPQDRLKAYYEADLKAISKDNPSGFPSARQKREAKQSARERLEQEAKDGRWRKWKCLPVAWDAVRNEVYFGSASSTAADRFVRLFTKTFEADLFQDSNLAGGLTVLTAGRLANTLRPKAQHCSLSPFVPNVTPDDRPSWSADDKVPDWLGNEFLLWLWYHYEHQGDTLTLPDESKVTFFFSGGMKLDCPRGRTGKDTLNSDSAVRLPEALAAAKSGKLPRKAALTCVRHDEQYSFLLQAETLAVSSAKLPPIDPAIDSQHDREAGRLQSLRDLAECVGLMFSAFLSRRLSSYWDGELKEMQGWLKGGRVKA